MKKEKENVAVRYVRVSTKKVSQKESPENQREACEQKAISEGLKISYTYEDRDTGTSIMGRPEIQQMLKDAEEGLFNTIIFASLSRFSRDSYDALSLKRVLVDKEGIRLIAIDEAYDSMIDEDELKFQIMNAVNQKLSEQISIASRRGIKSSAQRGNFTGSIAPYGYKKLNFEKDGLSVKTLEIIEEHAQWVKKIFDLYANHQMGEKNIINYLNEEKVPTPGKGKAWGISTVQRILQNEAYCGYNVHGKYSMKKMFNDRNNLQDRSKKLIQNDKKNWEKNPEKNWEPIITDEIFQEAQNLRLLRGNGAHGGARNVKVNPFADILKCAHCGSNMVSMKSGKNGKDNQAYRYLICSSRRRMGVAGCENSLWIPLHTFGEQLRQQIIHELKARIDVAETSQNAKLDIKQNKVSEKEIKKLEAELVKARRGLSTLNKEYRNGDMVDEAQYLFEKEDYEQDIESLTKRLSRITKIQENKTNENDYREKIKLELHNLSELEFDQVEEMQLTLKQLVEKVTVDQEGKTTIFI